MSTKTKKEVKKDIAYWFQNGYDQGYVFYGNEGLSALLLALTVNKIGDRQDEALNYMSHSQLEQYYVKYFSPECDDTFKDGEIFDAWESGWLKGIKKFVLDNYDNLEILVREKKEDDISWYNDGLNEGKYFAEHARNDELKEALAYEKIGNFDTYIFNGNSCSACLCDLKDYFQNMFQVDCRKPFSDGAIWEQWEQGWVDGVRAFWDKVKDES